jgi:hypothetical protein
MKGHAAAKRFVDRRSESRRQVGQRYSLEMSIEGRDVRYRFKVWNKATKSIGFLVRKDSDILSRLRVGSTLNMKYYATDLVNHTEYLKTAIRHITEIDQGRLKGHYLVGAEVLRSQERTGELQEAS